MGTLRAAILGRGDGWHVRSLHDSLARRGIEAAYLPSTRIVSRCAPSGTPLIESGGIELGSLDMLFVRSLPGGSLEQVIYRVDALHRLQDLGVRVINSAAVIERTVDKLFTLCLLEKAGLPVPATVACEKLDQAMEAFEELGGDVVVKPIFGSEGRGMIRVSDTDLAYRVFSALEQQHYIFYLQEFLPHANRDYRLFIVDGKVIGAMRRTGRNWKSNVAQGAQVAQVEPDRAMKALALEAAGVFDADYLGVDLLRTVDGRNFLLEVNGIPGWRGFQKATGIDAGDVLVDHILGEISRKAVGRV
ncbi:MAG TPA: RimK family alpha-L-glutamate ligase [Synergistaceae bacterium]|nr:RimK family alpha-L-glutamate ligase [Synergistaceae bacterium]